MWDRREHKLVRKTFDVEAEAKNWRADARGEMRDGVFTTPTRDTFRQVAEQWRAEAEAGVARNSSGQPYKPSTLRGHRTSLDKRLLPEFGAHPWAT